MSASLNLRKSSFLMSSSQFPGTAHTVFLQMAMDDEQKRAMGQRLAELRGSARPQRVIANRLGVTERTYGSWERGESMPQWDNLEAVAEIYGVSPNFLLYGSDTAPQNAASQLDKIEARLDAIESSLALLHEQTGQLTEVERDLLRQVAGALDRLGRDVGRGHPQQRSGPGSREEAA